MYLSQSVVDAIATKALTPSQSKFTHTYLSVFENIHFDLCNSNKDNFFL